MFDPSPVVSTGSITFDCTGVLPADAVRIDLDAGGAASFTPRRLIAGVVALAYNLYLDAARTVVWGDGTGGSSAYGPVHPAEGSTTLTIYGRIPAGQHVAAGSYSDTVTVTLQF